jgi:hypothetical protein
MPHVSPSLLNALNYINPIAQHLFVKLVGVSGFEPPKVDRYPNSLYT